MVVAHRMSETDYQEFVLSTPEGSWELHDGHLVEKPGMSWKHGSMVTRLIIAFGQQLDPADYRVFTELRVRRPADTVFLPDLMVVPTALGQDIADLPALAIFSDPLPLVVEIWSPSTGDYDVDTKVPVYQERGDLEIWRIHPYERTLTRWVRQSDGTYLRSVLRGGTVAPITLPGVVIDLDRLFAS